MEGRKCSRKNQRNRMNNSIRYAVKRKRVFEPAGKIQYCYSLTVRKDGTPAGLFCGFPGKERKKAADVL